VVVGQQAEVRLALMGLVAVVVVGDRGRGGGRRSERSNLRRPTI